MIELLIIGALCGTVTEQPPYTITHQVYDDGSEYSHYVIQGPPKAVGQLAENILDATDPTWRLNPVHPALFTCRKAYQDGELYVSVHIPQYIVRCHLEGIIARQYRELIKKLSLTP